MYYKKIIYSLLLVAFFPQAIADQPYSNEILNTAYINQTSTPVAKILAADSKEKIVSEIRRIQQQLEFYQGLVKSNVTLKSYRIQQEKLAGLEEKLAELYLKRSDTERSMDAMRRALEYYRNMRGLAEEAKVKWLWQQSSVYSRMMLILKAQGRMAEAIDHARQITFLYQQLIAEKPESYLAHSDLANHYFSLARLQVTNNQPDQAQQSLNLARKQYELLNKHDNNRLHATAGRWDFRLLEVRVELAAIEALNDSEAAIKAYQQVRDDMRVYLLKVPDNQQRRAYLAEEIHVPLALLHQQLGDLPAAQMERGRAHAIFAQLARVQPQENAIRINLAANQVQLAEYHKSLNQPERAIVVFQAAQQQYAYLLQKEPKENRWRHYQSIVLGAIGELYFQQGENDLSLQYQQQSISLVQQLVKADPTSVQWAQTLLVAHWRSAQVYLEQQQPDKALLAYQQVLQAAGLALKAMPEAIENRSTVAEAHENLADTYRQLNVSGELPEYDIAATKHYQQALWHYWHLAEGDADTEDRNTRLLQVVDQYLDIAVLYNARKHYAAAIAICESVQPFLDEVRLSQGLVDEDVQGLSLFALSHALMAQNRAALNQGEGALAAFSTAHETYRQLITREPAKSLWQVLLATSLMVETEWHRQSTNYELAIDRNQQAIRLYHGLHNSDPRNLGHQESQAVAYRTLGDLYQESYQRLAALETFDQAERINLLLKPSDAEPASEWYVTQHHIAARQSLNLTLTGDMSGAFSKKQELHELVQQASSNEVSGHIWRGYDALAILDLGIANADQGDTQQAHQLYEQALAQLERGMPDAETDDYTFMSYVRQQIHRAKASLAEELGDAEQFEQHLNIRRELISEQLEQNPEVIAWMAEQAIVTIDHGDLMLLNDQEPKALRQFHDAEKQALELLEAEPDNPDYLFYMAAVYERLGQIHFDRDKLEKSEKLYRAEQKLYHRLLRQDPLHTHWLQGLSENYRRLAAVYHEKKDYFYAVDTLGKAQAISRELVLRSPEHSVWQFNLAINYYELGKFWAGREDNRKASDYLQLAIRENLKLTERNSGVVKWQTQLATTYLELAGLAVDPEQKKSELEKAYKILHDLEEQGRLYPAYRKLLGDDLDELNP